MRWLALALTLVACGGDRPAAAPPPPPPLPDAAPPPRPDAGPDPAAVKKAELDRRFEENLQLLEKKDPRKAARLRFLHRQGEDTSLPADADDPLLADYKQTKWGEDWPEIDGKIRLWPAKDTRMPSTMMIVVQREGVKPRAVTEIILPGARYQLYARPAVRAGHFLVRVDVDQPEIVGNATLLEHDAQGHVSVAETQAWHQPASPTGWAIPY